MSASTGLSCALVLCLAAAPAQAAQRDLVVQVSVPAAAALGTNAGDVRCALREVTDATFSESDSHVGMGPQAIYEIVSQGSRQQATREGVRLGFERAGLLATAPDAPCVVDVTIRRFHEQTHMTFGRFRLRAEIFLEFAFHQAGAPAGRVLAAGNAQQYAQIASQRKYAEVYQAAFNDAIHKVFNSRTLARVAGEGWKPAPAPAVSGSNDAIRIKKDEFYGPTDQIQARAAQSAPAMQAAGALDVLLLPDFQLDEVTGKAKDPVARPEFARALVPELVREHLEAFFPGAVARIERGPADGRAGLRVEGRLDDFRVGNFYARQWIGLGAGKDKLKGAVAFKDGSGNTLATVEVLSSNWGAGWQTKQGTVRDMADQFARDLAYFIVKTRVPDYQPPADMEVLFDGTPYPVPQRKS